MDQSNESIEKNLVLLFDCMCVSAAFKDLLREWAGVQLLLNVCRPPCRYLPERWHTICSMAGGWCTRSFQNHSHQTIPKRTSTVYFTNWGWRDLSAWKYRGEIVS